MDLEEVDQPGQVKQRLHSVLNVEQFHLPARLADNAVAAGEFAQAIAIDEVHSRKIDQEPFAASASMDVNQVSKLSMAVAQREPAGNIHNGDAILLSCSELKTHRLVGGAAFSAGIIFLVRPAFKRVLNHIRRDAVRYS